MQQLFAIQVAPPHHGLGAREIVARQHRAFFFLISGSCGAVQCGQHRGRDGNARGSELPVVARRMHAVGQRLSTRLKKRLTLILLMWSI
jgi:hypothetical protein